MIQPVHILRLKNGDEFHVENLVYCSSEGMHRAVLTCEGLGVFVLATSEPTHYQMIQNHCYAIWECK